MFGAFAPLPLRLGGSSEEGWTASQQSRVSADLVAAFRAAPLAILTINQAGTISSYHGQNGVGLANAPTVTGSGGDLTLTWSRHYLGPLWAKYTAEDQDFPWNILQVQVHASQSTVPLSVCGSVTSPIAVRVVLSTTGSAVVEIWGSWIPLPQIGTYGGDPSKEDSLTEGDLTYASQLYMEIQGMRGSAFSIAPSTYVHCENLALARFWGYQSFRLPEKMRASAVPERSDERLPYWCNILGIVPRPGEETWSIRQRCALSYKIALGPTNDTVVTAITDLLGDSLVGITFPTDDPFSTVPDGTYFYPTNPGDPTLSLTNAANGTWTSRRSSIRIQVQWLPTMTEIEFFDLVNTQLWQMLDTLLPAWMIWTWYQDLGHDGFLLDISHLDIDGFDP